MFGAIDKINHKEAFHICNEQKYEDLSQITYLPATFEGMMEQFGINLQRRKLYHEYYDNVNHVVDISGKVTSPKKDIIQSV